VSIRLSIRLLGGLNLRLDNVPVPALGSARAESLLAYLLLNRETPQARQHVAFRLWPESTESQARTNLRHVLHDLRRTLPEADRFLNVQTRTVQWRPGAPFWLDVAAFDEAVTRADEGRSDGDDVIVTLRQAVELYRGDLLEACYDEWISGSRKRLRQRFLAALERLAMLLDESGNHVAAIPYVERLLQHEPLREDAYRLLMRLHDARADRARAVQAYRTCVATLKREVGVAPSTATRHAYEALLRGNPERTPTEPHGSGHAGSRISAPTLVGRADEWARLTALWRAVERGEAGFLLVTGEPGVGKTRLIEELREWCALRGAITADSRSYAAEGSLAYAPIAAWLRTPAIDKRVARLDRQRLSELSRLLPELLTRVPDVPNPQLLPEDEQRRRLFDAAASTLLSLDAPILLVADDIHWCDHESLRFLHYLLRSAAKTRLLVAAAARLEEMERCRLLLDLMTGLRALDRVTGLDLEPLTRDATTDLAARLTSRTLEPVDADALFRETEGNPLFVIEAVRAGWQRGGRPANTLTPRVHAVIASRLDRLSETTRELVGTAATIGREFTLDLLARTTDISPDVVARSLDELWRARIVREHDTGAYDFTHDKIREVAYLALSPPARRGAHLRAAQALKQLKDHDPEAVSGQIAAHYDHAGVAQEAITWYESAAEAAQRLYASGEAIRLMTRALTLLESLGATPERQARELAILTAILTPVASVEGFTSRGLDDIQRRIIELARRLAVDLPPQVLRSLAISSLSRDNFDDARAYGEQLQARGRADADDALLVESEYVLGIAAFWKGELEAARHHFEVAVAAYRPDRRPAHLLRYWLDPQVVCLSRLGNTLWFLGDAVAACHARDGALALAADIGHEPSRRVALIFGALLALEMEDIERFREYVAALDAGQTEHDARPNRVSTQVLGAYVRVLDGQWQRGIATIRGALDDLDGGGHAPGQRAVVGRVLISAYAAARDPRRRLAAAEQLLAMGGAASLWEAEAHRVRAECLAELGASADEIVAVIDRAVAVARRQGALSVERRAVAMLDRCRPAADRGSMAVTSH
jgi:DNA-binding SARP family transcriptional activator